MTALAQRLRVERVSDEDIDTARRAWAALLLNPGVTDAECAAARARLKCLLRAGDKRGQATA